MMREIRPVAVAERVNGDDMQVRHRCADGNGGFDVAVLEPLHDLIHQAGDVACGRTDIRGCSATRARDLDRAGSVLTRMLVALEITRVEMQVEDDAV
jgi:hypothetical protein